MDKARSVSLPTLFIYFFFLEREYYDYASKNKYILIL